jgi:hypothetical protein
MSDDSEPQMGHGRGVDRAGSRASGGSRAATKHSHGTKHSTSAGTKGAAARHAAAAASNGGSHTHLSAGHSHAKTRSFIARDSTKVLRAVLVQANHSLASMQATIHDLEKRLDSIDAANARPRTPLAARLRMPSWLSTMVQKLKMDSLWQKSPWGSRAKHPRNGSRGVDGARAR